MSTESRNDVEKILLHTRDVSSKGYIRTDGMFDIEGIITDKKSYDIPKSDGTILKEGEPLHQMVVKITLDINMTIIDYQLKLYQLHMTYVLGLISKFKT